LSSRKKRLYVFPRHRPARTLTELFELRKERDAYLAEKRRVFGQRALARAKARYDAHPGEPVVWNLLLISGGGDWGAFGTGFLKGWSRLHRPLTKPEFDVVTGVSTGALISPFAFLGDDESIEAVVALYRNPNPDWVKTRWARIHQPGARARPEIYRQRTRIVRALQSACAMRWPINF
jgi:hypothetical protein